MKTNIELQKRRSVSEVISDTFTFLSMEWKYIFTQIAKYALPFYFIGILIMAFSGFYNQAGMNGAHMYQKLLARGGIASLFLGAFMMFIGTCVCLVVVNLHIKNIHHFQIGKIIKQEEISWNSIGNYVGKVLGGYILIGILVVLGFLLLIIPGIYLAIVFTLFLPIMFLTDSSIGESISMSFNYIKSHWWETFAIVFVVGIVGSIISFFTQIPYTAFIFVKGIMGSFGNVSFSFTLIVALTQILTAIGKMFALVLSSIAVALQFLSLKEMKDGDSLLNKIEQADEL
ncbi:MAG: hypothetical protein N4A49_09345 [Marinifilaceae bacterium]|jgi:hypothetical protein|nr:hypothetical protein [Marinifilaceae bacterium]